MKEGDHLRAENETLRVRLASLTEATLRISEELDLGAVLQEVADSARSLTDARYSAIITLDDAEELQDLLISGLTPEEKQVMMEFPEPVALFKYLTGIQEPLRTRDFVAHIKSLGFPEFHPPIGAFLGAPIRARDKHVGNIYLAEMKGGRDFTREDEETLEMFAAQAAMAITNARRYGDEQRAKADLEALVNTSPVGVLVFDARTREVVKFNQEARRIVGATDGPPRACEQLLKSMTFRRLDGQEIPRAELPLERAIRSGETIRAEEIVIHLPGGETVSTLINTTPIYAEDGKIVSVVATIQDITPLEEVERLRAEFLGMVSHELRTPLTSIKGSAANALGALSPLDPAEMRQYLDATAIEAGVRYTYRVKAIRNGQRSGRSNSASVLLLTDTTPRPLVGNIGQSDSSTAVITQQYTMGFRLGNHGQGYEISSVSIELAAAPSSLTVSMWSGAPQDNTHRSVATFKLFDFNNPTSFRAGLNKFTAPPGHGCTTMSITTSCSRFRRLAADQGDGVGRRGPGRRAGGRPQERREGPRVGFDRTLGYFRIHLARQRAAPGRRGLEAGPRHPGFELRASLRRPRNHLAFRRCGYPHHSLSSGAAPHPRFFLARGRHKPKGPPIHNPFDLLSGTTSLGTKLFGLTVTRYGPGINVWTAPQGATVAGSSSYLVHELYDTRPSGTILTRVFGTTSDDLDTPTAPGVFVLDSIGNFALDHPLMAVLGEPLHPMVSNFGQTDDSYKTVDSTTPFVSQGFTTGSESFGYHLQGIGVNIEGSGSNYPDGPSDVSVAVHADASGQPGGKLFDLVSPDDYTSGHSFFEAPPGTTLAPNTSYVLVWKYLSGTAHRLRRTASDSEDSGPLTGFSIADAFYSGSALGSLSVASGGRALEIVPYGVAADPPALGYQVPQTGSTYRTASKWGTSSGWSSSPPPITSGTPCPGT